MGSLRGRVAPDPPPPRRQQRRGVARRSPPSARRGRHGARAGHRRSSAAPGLPRGPAGARRRGRAHGRRVGRLPAPARGGRRDAPRVASDRMGGRGRGRCRAGGGAAGRGGVVAVTGGGRRSIARGARTADRRGRQLWGCGRQYGRGRGRAGRGPRRGPRRRRRVGWRPRPPARRRARRGAAVARPRGPARARRRECTAGRAARGGRRARRRGIAQQPGGYPRRRASRGPRGGARRRLAGRGRPPAVRSGSPLLARAGGARRGRSGGAGRPRSAPGRHRGATARGVAGVGLVVRAARGPAGRRRTVPGGGGRWRRRPGARGAGPRPGGRAARRAGRAAGRVGPVAARAGGPPDPCRAGVRAGGLPVNAPDLLDRVRARLAVEPGIPTRSGVAALVREESGGLLGDDDVLLAVREAVDELAGAGPLEALLRRPGVTDVLVNGPDEVWVDEGGGLTRTRLSFPDDEAVRRLAVRLSAAAGRRLDDAAPWVDVGLPDGTRLHAVLPPVSGSGTCLSLRVLRRTRHSLADLASLGTLPGKSEELLRSLVARRLAFLVTGGTGSGRQRCCRPFSGRRIPATGSCCARTPPN